eukprot:scaffold121237_cov18-Tisochrysis_lutea.AAC.1
MLNCTDCTRSRTALCGSEAARPRRGKAPCSSFMNRHASSKWVLCLALAQVDESVAALRRDFEAKIGSMGTEAGQSRALLEVCEGASQCEEASFAKLTEATSAVVAYAWLRLHTDISYKKRPRLRTVAANSGKMITLTRPKLQARRSHLSGQGYRTERARKESVKKGGRILVGTVALTPAVYTEGGRDTTSNSYAPDMYDHRVAGYLKHWKLCKILDYNNRLAQAESNMSAMVDQSKIQAKVRTRVQATFMWTPPSVYTRCVVRIPEGIAAVSGKVDELVGRTAAAEAQVEQVNATVAKQ